ncbi:YqeB family protein [Micromonospora sp. CA-246542]|uniref:YqeB family protein n=1 Tax=Micromonospora sp. CA-246542 TaxID=3239959 RepID=UPI003D89E0DC
MDAADYRPRTVVTGGPLELVVLWGGFPLLGAGAGWLLAASTGWLARLSWVPFGDLIRWLDRLPEPQATLGAVAVGVLAGLVVAGVGTAERLIVTVDSTQVRLRRADQSRSVARADTRAAFLADKHLVLLDGDGAELVRESTDLPAAHLAAAFRAHGWAWTDDDPHRSAYRLWVPDLPGLPVGADALLHARERALERDRRDDVRELRRELGRLGVVLRDEGTPVLANRRPRGRTADFGRAGAGGAVASVPGDPGSAR